MKRWIALSVIVLLGFAAIWVSERRKVDVPASPAALLYLIGDTEQELTRMPVRFTRMSDEEEIRVGDQLARAYTWEGAPETYPEIKEVDAYLSRVGSRLAPLAHRRLPYRFHYLPDRSLVNAFALPGGHVYVGAGLLSLMDSEDELAAVMGHELEHIDHYHCAERVQQEQALRRIPFGQLIEMPVEVFEAGYSKDQELEADREGTRLAVEAGYSANGAIRMFETFERLYQEYETRAKTPQDELSDVAQQTISGYFRSHPLSSERIEQVKKLIASEHWEVRQERDLAVAYVFWTIKANTALESRRYQQAEQLAKRSLKVREEQPRALDVLAHAQFAQAEFGAAADAYRKLFEFKPTVETATLYADSLAAADPHTAAGEFRRWAESVTPKAPQGVELLQAGLDWMTGNSTAAQQLRTRFSTSLQDARVPEQMGELGWWAYRAGDYASATDLLSQAVQQRPGSGELRVQLAWSLAELRRYSDALQAVSIAYDESGQKPERMMARAVTEWQAQQPDEALRDGETAIASQPEWENTRWVGALYSARVASSVHEMEVERNRRKRSGLRSP